MRATSSLITSIVIIVVILNTQIILIILLLLNFVFLSPIHQILFKLSSELLLLLGEELLLCQVLLVAALTGKVFDFIAAFLLTVVVLIVEVVETHHHHFAFQFLLFVLGEVTVGIFEWELLFGGLSEKLLPEGVLHLERVFELGLLPVHHIRLGLTTAYFNLLAVKLHISFLQFTHLLNFVQVNHKTLF